MFAVLDKVTDIANHALSLDPQMAERLSKLSGKTLEIQLSHSQQRLYLEISNSGRLMLQQQASYQVCTCIIGSEVDLLFLFGGQFLGAPVTASQLSITGNVSFVNSLMTCVQQLRIDWEEQLAGIVGDIPAHQLARGARMVQSWAKQSLANMRANISDYVLDEKQVIPAREEVSDFMHSIDQIRDDVERLSARIARLLPLGE